MRLFIVLLIGCSPLIGSAQHRPMAPAPAWNSGSGLQFNDLLEGETGLRMALLRAEKSEGLAFLLGVYFPGLGSLYAGNTTHFWRHFALTLLSIPVGALSILGGPVAFYAVFAGFLFNYGWSLAVAVKDVQRHNELHVTQPTANLGVTLIRLRL